MANRETLLRLVRSNRALPRRLARVRQLSPDRVRARYFERLRQTVLRSLWAMIAQDLLPRLPALAAAGKAARGSEAHKDAAGDEDVGGILDEIADRYFERWSRDNFRRVVQPYAQDVAKFNAAQLNKVLHQIAGVDVVGSEPWLGDVLAAFTRENVALIKSVPSQFFADIEKHLSTQMADGERWEGMADMLQERFGVAQSRANLIARDQVGKLYGDLNRVRQTDLGIDGYVWRTMRDNRVRDEHEQRDGERYLWSGPPEDGAPGEAVQCRCYADPDLTAILREAGVHLPED